MVVESAELCHMIRGYHIYKSIWIPEIGEVLTMKKEDGNIHNRFACGIYFVCGQCRGRCLFDGSD